MEISGPGQRAPRRAAALLVLATLALTGCQTGASHGAVTRDAPLGRPAVVEPVTPADRAVERIDRDRAGRGFVDGCRQYVLVEHDTWRVVCVVGR